MQFVFLLAETKVYVGNLGTGAGKGELERAFSYYGPLRTVWIARNPPGFAFVEFEDPRDAEDAVRGLDGKVICGSRVRVELSTGMPRRSRYDRPPARRPFDPNDRCYECGEKGHYAYDCHRYSRRRRSRYVKGSHVNSCTCDLILVFSNLKLGHGLDLIQGPEAGDTLVHVAEVVAGGLSRHADLDRFLLVDPGLSRHADLVRVSIQIKIQVQVHFTTQKQPFQIKITISKEKSFTIRKPSKECES
ncbi:hypothetical protein JD844_025536 [Phrynosoma platyrhinos]|uniref:Serine/arginine-rich splicing factor 7 n=1 Tax=Phrynosoma platyrhinos TaxID=52577 RepID=A0ABQ7SZR7_PHRPL|nr:hypothetical protein JD844_025536 [Phrynosoma platyrhinos]